MVALTGFVAQSINSSIGMAFGVISTTALVSLAFSAPMASSIVHLSEITTSAANFFFHWKNGNINRKVFISIGIPGAIGAFIGALILSRISLAASKPVTASILLVLGLVLVLKNIRKNRIDRLRRIQRRWLYPLGFTAGLIDANAGGGWGTIVTSTLQTSNVTSPREAVGTSTSARILVALFGSLGFVIGLGFERIDWLAVLALSAGGAIASPFAAKLVSKLRQSLIGLITGITVFELSLRQVLVSAGASLELTISAMLGGLVAILVCVMVLRQKAK